MNRRELGRFGEDLAARFLETRGLQLVERNWRCRAGEIDLIARDDRGLAIFCEVKTRSGSGFGDPLESLTREKIARMRELVGHWVAANPGAAQLRLDAVAVVLEPTGLHLRHLQGIG